MKGCLAFIFAEKSTLLTHRWVYSPHVSLAFWHHLSKPPGRKEGSRLVSEHWCWMTKANPTEHCKDKQQQLLNSNNIGWCRNYSTTTDRLSELGRSGPAYTILYICIIYFSLLKASCPPLSTAHRFDHFLTLFEIYYVQALFCSIAGCRIIAHSPKRMHEISFSSLAR